MTEKNDTPTTANGNVRITIAALVKVILILASAIAAIVAAINTSGCAGCTITADESGIYLDCPDPIGVDYDGNPIVPDRVMARDAGAVVPNEK